MARQGKLEKNKRRERLIELHAERRKELKATAMNQNLPEEEREEAMRKLRKMTLDSHPNRLRRRCSLTGRPRAHLRKFGISRIKFRELTHRGEIPGCKKASW